MIIICDVLCLSNCFNLTINTVRVIFFYFVYDYLELIMLECARMHLITI